MTNNEYMQIAFEESLKAYKIDEIPVGAVVVQNGEIIGRGYNKKEKTKNAIMHAEIIAINQACNKNKDWRLNDCEIYVTLEPCMMCMGAIIESRIKKIYCGIKNNKSHVHNKKICDEQNVDIEFGMLSDEIITQMNSFFKNIRK